MVSRSQQYYLNNPEKHIEHKKRAAEAYRKKYNEDECFRNTQKEKALSRYYHLKQLRAEVQQMGMNVDEEKH